MVSSEEVAGRTSLPRLKRARKCWEVWMDEGRPYEMEITELRPQKAHHIQKSLLRLVPARSVEAKTRANTKMIKQE